MIVQINKKSFRFIFLGIVLIVGFSSCKSGNDGYQTTETGLEYKFLKKNKQAKHAKVGDYIELKFNYKNNKDSVLFNSNEIANSIKIQLNKSAYNASFEEAVGMLRTGERALFKIPALLFYQKTKKNKVPVWIKKGDKLTFDIELIRVLNKAEVEKEQELLKQKRRTTEDQLLAHYLKTNNITKEASLSGMYYIETKKGDGMKVKPGDMLMVHYTGKFIDGEVFDSSIERNEPFLFRQGKGAVIPGWEEGFSKMREGGKAKFIIPSQLAYGAKGYGKIIPPYSTLIFDVELIKIKK